MTGFSWLFLLSVTWAAMTERFTLSNLAVGFLLALLIVAVSSETTAHKSGAPQPAPGGPVIQFHRKVFRVVRFILFFFYELVRANVRVAHDVLTPTWYMKPGVIAVPLDAVTDTEITWLANLISLTPGTLSLDISSDRKVLYIYVLFLDDRESLIREIKAKLERPVLEILR